MKKIQLILSLCLASASVFSQSADKPVNANSAVCKVFPNKPAGAVPVFPKTAYTPLEDPSCAPCYEYRSKYGYMVMECPFLRFPAEHGNQEQPVSGMTPVQANGGSAFTVQNDANSTLEVSNQKAYTGNYPAACLRDPNMPEGAVPAWPKGEYTALENPSCAPCYEYRSKYGYMVMECPFLRFPPEHKE